MSLEFHHPYVDLTNSESQTLSTVFKQVETLKPGWHAPDAEDANDQIIEALQQGLLPNVEFKNYLDSHLQLLLEKFANPVIRENIFLPRLQMTLDAWIKQFTPLSLEERLQACAYGIDRNSMGEKITVFALLPQDVDLLIVSHNNHIGITVDEIIQENNDLLYLSTLNLKISVAGASVGAEILYKLAQRFPYFTFVTADPKNVARDKAQRTITSLVDEGRNKSDVLAERIHAIFPFIPIAILTSGITPENIDDVLLGAFLFIDEMDHLPTKLAARHRAMELGIKFAMFTDAKQVVVEVRDFDEGELDEFAFTDPETVQRLLNEFVKAKQENDTQRLSALFVEIACTIVGNNNIPADFRAHLELKAKDLVSYIPQPTDVVAEATVKAILVVEAMQQEFLRERR